MFLVLAAEITLLLGTDVYWRKMKTFRDLENIEFLILENIVFLILENIEFLFEQRTLRDHLKSWKIRTFFISEDLLVLVFLLEIT